ncbi:MAG: FMN-binding glutamate synthase family protein [Acidihalobacter sp.]
MRYYLINVSLLLAPLGIFMLGADWVGILVGLLLWASYAGDRWLSDNPLYRNYPLTGRLLGLIRRSSRIALDRPYPEGSVHVIMAYGRGEAPYSSFGTRHLPDDKLWVRHSNFSVAEPRGKFVVTVGGKDCAQPYECALFNISALSFGALTANAIKALSMAAHRGGFFYNTGEAGLHSAALEGKGELVWQIGTGYFGCRDKQGRFDEEAFTRIAHLSNVRMVEIKLSQGSKPALGGFLPASKVNKEIAELCGIPAYKDSVLPMRHAAFDSPSSLLRFITRLRKLSDGKPVGIKLCVGQRSEVEALVRAMAEADTFPDYIAIDGNDGGSGAAPVEYQDGVGIPLREGLQLFDSLLRQAGLRNNIRLIASGKIVTAKDVFASIAHGADICVAARPFLLAMGCVQALACETGMCPTGITSSHWGLDKGVSPGKRAQYLANYQRGVVETFGKMLASADLTTPSQITPAHIGGPES